MTNLRQELESREVKTIYCVGLAFDYCVGSTAIDGAKLGFRTYLVTDATKSVASQSHQVMDQRLKEGGVIFITSEEVLA